MSPLANNKEFMKQENRRQVLELIHRRSISRSGIAEETGLTLSAISSIVNELTQVGIVCEAKKVDETAFGRKPILLDIVPSWKSIIGISLDHEGFDIGLVDIKGQPFGQFIHLPYRADTTTALDEIAASARRLVSESGLQDSDILGVGAIVPGPVDVENGQILNPPTFKDWHYLKLRDCLQSRLPYRVYVQHNSNALARAECNMGIGKRYNSFALLVINAGIGLGLVLNGRVYSGANGLGCEIAHISIDINGRLCPCGNRGCLELYASTASILYEAGRVRPDIRTWEQLIDQAYAGDDFCVNLLDMQAKYLSHSIINLNNLLELEAVILSGQVMYRGKLLLEKLRSSVQKSVLSKSTRSLQIELSTICDNAMIAAAGAVLTDELFQGNLYKEVSEALLK